MLKRANFEFIEIRFLSGLQFAATRLLVVVNICLWVGGVDESRLAQIREAGRVNMGAGGENGQTGDGHSQEKDEKTDAIHHQGDFLPFQFCLAIRIRIHEPLF